MGKNKKKNNANVKMERIKGTVQKITPNQNHLDRAGRYLLVVFYPDGDKKIFRFSSLSPAETFRLENEKIGNGTSMRDMY